MAIRTIVVTTRSAVRSHRRAGHDEKARASAARGLSLLDELAVDSEHRPPDAVDAARDEIRAMLDGGLSPVGPGPAEEESPHPARTGRRSHGAPTGAR